MSLREKGSWLEGLLFILIAFSGTIPASALVQAVLTQWIFKVAYEVLATPFTYWVVGFLKRKEQLDTYDHQTNFSPLLWRRSPAH